jgi:transcriptional regulator with XRE-family HTH domain
MGLRRIEVAAAAGVSVDYYTRLEQGRERSPSPQVVASLARALTLDSEGQLHLFRLAGLSPVLTDPLPERVEPALFELMAMWTDIPAMVLNRAYDIVAANDVAEALFSPVIVGGNLALTVFLGHRAREFYQDWTAAARNTAAGLRLNKGASPSDERLSAVVEQLATGSAEFSELWDDNRVNGKNLEAKRFRHPEIGPVTLRMQSFGVRSNPAQELVVYHAEPGSTSAAAINELTGGTGGRSSPASSLGVGRNNIPWK